MTTDDVTERVVYKRRGSARRVRTETNYSKPALAKRLCLSHSRCYLASASDQTSSLRRALI